MISSERDPNVNDAVNVTINWSAPSDRDGAFNYTLTYTADQTPEYPQERSKVSSGSLVLLGSMEQYVIEDGLPYAVYSVTITAYNLKRSLPGPSNSETHRSLPTGKPDITLRNEQLSCRVLDQTFNLCLFQSRQQLLT